MARRHTLTGIAITGTACLWGATITLAITGTGSDRLHETLRTAAFTAALVTAGIIGLMAFRAYTARAIEAAVDAVKTGVDELHGAVEELKTNVLHYDRGFVTAARAMMAGLLDGTTGPGGRKEDGRGEKAA